MNNCEGIGRLLNRESNLLLENGELRKMNENDGKRIKGGDFLLQGAILAAAGIIVRFIGLIYKIPMTRILDDEGIGYYNTAYEIYNIGLILSSYSLPLAVSKLLAGYEYKGERENSRKVLLCGWFSVIHGKCRRTFCSWEPVPWCSSPYPQ